jgi:hypothetical protein
MAWTAWSARLYRWQSRVSSLGWRLGRDHVAMLILTPEGQILDRHILTCADNEEAKETAKVFADSNTVEVWKGPIRIVRFEPMQ